MWIVLIRENVTAGVSGRIDKGTEKRLEMMWCQHGCHSCKEQEVYNAVRTTQLHTVTTETIDKFGGDQEGAVGKQCGDYHTWMDVHVVRGCCSADQKPRGGLIPRKRLEERLAAFNVGDWVTLIEFSLECTMPSAVAQSRKRPGQTE